MTSMPNKQPPIFTKQQGSCLKGTQKLAAIAVVAVSTSVISSFHGIKQGIEHEYLQRLEQSNYAKNVSR